MKSIITIPTQFVVLPFVSSNPMGQKHFSIPPMTAQICEQEFPPTHGCCAA